MAVKEEKIEVRGEVIEALRSGTYRVALEGGGHEVLAYVTRKMRKYRIRIVVGDHVQVESLADDLKRGRIVFRQRSEQAQTA